MELLACEDGMELRARVMRREDPEQGPRPMIKLSDDSGMNIILGSNTIGIIQCSDWMEHAES